MLETLQSQPADALLALIKLHDADRRSDKIDLGVGVYRTNTGATPVFAAIKEAERRLVETQDSKAYLGPEGDMGFVEALKPWIFGAGSIAGRPIGGMQTPGGTGAVRLAAALAARAGARRIHLGVPSWPNHRQIFDDLNLETVEFAHADADGVADLGALLAAIGRAGRHDAVLLHGCCHNPTGIDYTPDQWRAIAAALADSAALPIIDLAYHGLGGGMDEDAAGMREVLAAVPQALVAYSCDKNFGLYRDRVGALYFLASASGQLDTIASNANALARAAWSMPPDHGAAAVRLVLGDAALTAQWQEELTAMRTRMRRVRARLAAADNAVPGLNLAAIGGGNGLFAILPLDRGQIEALRRDHAVYMAGSGRINVAGLTEANTPRFIAALAEVTRAGALRSEQPAAG
jgi:aromatic-amino-acid transaminase